MKILLIEDDSVIATIIKDALKRVGFSVKHFKDGTKGKKHALIKGSQYSVIILDIILPGVNGLEIARSLRAAKVRTPILMLSTRDQVSHKVQGLDSGGDDYLVKPFEIDELIARIRALARRGNNFPDKIYRIGNFALDTQKRKVQIKKKEIPLTDLQYRLLLLLVSKKGTILTRNEIVDQVWTTKSSFVSSNTLNVHIKELRKKLSKRKKDSLIKTVRGVGYVFKEK